MLKSLLIAAMAILPGTIAYSQSTRVVLVTEEEAKRPDLPKSELTFRAGVSRGPAISLVSPESVEKGLPHPFRLQLKFEGRGGAQIDADSLKITYLKKPPVDLTDRVKPFVKPVGLDILETEIPAGAHVIRVEIKDKDGRAGSAIFNLNVTN